MEQTPGLIFNHDYAKQTSIPFSRTILLRDLAIQLRFLITSVIRFLGQDYTGDHLPRRAFLERVKPLVDPPLF